MKNPTGKSARKPDAAGRLPDAELDVLACLWRLKHATAAEIRVDLADRRPMAHGSVLTLLKRLAARGLVTREKGPRGKAFVFRPTRRPEPTHRRILQDLADRVFGGNRVAMIASLLETGSPTQEEIDELRELLDQLKGK